MADAFVSEEMSLARSKREPVAYPQLEGPVIPRRSLFISLASLLVPVLGELYFKEGADQYQLLLWLLALVPSFILAYHRGWKGVATALVAGMSVLSLTQVALQLTGDTQVDWLPLLVILTLFITVSLGLGIVSELLHRERQRAERLSLTDELTGLPNRRYLRLFLETEFAAAQRGRALVVCLFDLDEFKNFNDRWGHAAGDAALLAFSEVLAGTTRRMNMSGRWGGEEFLSIISSSPIEGTLIFVERVRSGLAAMAKSLEEPISVSVGVAAFTRETKDVDELISFADQALYAAKSAGRDAVRVHGSTLRHAAVADAG